MHHKVAQEIIKYATISNANSDLDPHGIFVYDMFMLWTRGHSDMITPGICRAPSLQFGAGLMPTLRRLWDSHSCSASEIRADILVGGHRDRRRIPTPAGIAAPVIERIAAARGCR